MYNEGDITRTVDLPDPTSGRFSQLVRRVSNLIARPATPDIMAEQCVIVTALLKVIFASMQASQLSYAGIGLTFFCCPLFDYARCFHYCKSITQL